MTFEDLQRANETIKTLDVKGKEYAEVNQRIKAFRMLYPEGTIETTMLSNENGVCVFKAVIKVNDLVLGTGTAYEKENSTFINKTSYIENCETSAVGRALAMCGIGIDTSIASAEEVTNAINNQDPTKEEAEGYVFTSGKHKGQTILEVQKEDENYLEWQVNNRNDIKLNKMIKLLTGIEKLDIPEDEQMKRLELLNDLTGLVEITNTDYEKLLNHYGVDSNIKMTNEQLEEAIKILKDKLV